MSRDAYFIAMLNTVCARSTCVRRSVGAIITDHDGRLLSTGYNGPPRGFPHCVVTAPCAGAGDQPGDSRRCLAVHAEQNSMLFCHRLDLAETMYVSVTPCFTCAKLILQTPLARVVALAPYPGDDQGGELLRREKKLYFYDHESGIAQLCRAD